VDGDNEDCDQRLRTQTSVDDEDAKSEEKTQTATTEGIDGGAQDIELQEGDGFNEMLQLPHLHFSPMSI